MHAATLNDHQFQHKFHHEKLNWFEISNHMGPSDRDKQERLGWDPLQRYMIQTP